MATTTRAVLRQRLSEVISDYNPLTTSSAATTKNSLIDASLKNLPGGGGSNAFEEKFILITSGNNDGEIRRIRTYSPSTTTLTTEEDFTNTTDTAITYELHSYDPVHKHSAINRAIEELYPFLYNPIVDETLVVDNILTNSDFETFASSNFTGWTAVNSPTLTAETSLVMHGSQAAKVVAGGSAGQLTQAPTININEITNKAATFKMWVYATAASTARIRIDWDGTNFTNSDYHTGNDQWELLSATATVPSSATQVQAICEVVASGTGYFDAGWLAIEPQYRYTVPTSILQGPYRVLQQYSESDPDGPYHQIPKDGGPTTGRRLRIEGMGLLSRPTTDTGTVEVGEPHVNMIVSYAAMWLFRMLATTSAIEEADRWLANSQIYSRDASRMAAMPTIRMPKPSAEGNNRSWHLERSGEARTIVFDRPRTKPVGWPPLFS